MGMNSITIRPQRTPALKSGHVAGWAAATVVATCSATSATAATRVTFDSNAPRSISLAGSTSPLYEIKQFQNNQRRDETTRTCVSPGKFGCQGGYQNTIRTTVTRIDTRDFLSASPDALIGLFTYDSAMPTANESFTTNPENMYTKAQVVYDSGATSFGGAPVVPPIQESYPLRSGFLHLKFVTGGNTYLGLAKFDNSNNPGLSYIDYEALASPTAVPEPESWAMLIAGFGLTGAALRRSRHRGQRVQAAL